MAAEIITGVAAATTDVVTTAAVAATTIMTGAEAGLTEPALTMVTQ